MTEPAPPEEELRLARLVTRLSEGRKGFLRWPEEVDSTNSVLKAWAEEGAEAGSVLLAEKQRAGRGRMGRRFESPPGGLYLSYLLRPELAPAGMGGITAWTAVAVRRALARCCGFLPEIKWVNDLTWRGRKLCGILCEAALRGDRVESLVLGVGINVDTEPEDFPPPLRETAVSLRDVGCPVPDRSALAAELIRSLDAMAEDFPAAEETYWSEYRAGCVTLGQTVILPDGTEGCAEALERDFALLLRLPDGSLRRLQSGEATLHR